MLKITKNTIGLVKPSVIIANYPVTGDPQEEFKDGENAIPWTVMEFIKWDGFILETCFPNFATTAKDQKKKEELLNGRWWIYELKDLQHAH